MLGFIFKRRVKKSRKGGLRAFYRLPKVFGINAAGQQLPLAVYAALRHRLRRTLFRFLLAGGAR